MVISVALLLLGSNNFSKAADSKFSIVAASLFKNGYAVVTRALNVKPGTTVVSDIPTGALGTVWFQITDGLKISTVKNTFEPVETETSRGPSSIEELMKLNIGHTVKLGLDSKTSVSGKLISLNGQALLLQTKEGIKAIAPNTVVSVEGPASLTKTTVDIEKTKKRVLKITVTGNKPGRIYMIALEKGLSWSPAYSLDITDPKTLKFNMKATLLDDLGPIKGIETRLVTGFPNLLYAGTEDPIFARSSLEQYLQSIGASDAQRDAAKNVRMLSNNAMFGQAAGPGGGGFGGGAAYAKAFAPEPAEMGVSDNLPGIQAEDLFFYRLVDVQLELGDRGYYVLASGHVPFKEIYTWEGQDPVLNAGNFVTNQNIVRPPQDDQPIPVWHSLEFENTLGLPLTTAPAITVQDGEILGQDLLAYTSRGAKATVKITKALDVEADSYDEELSRESGSLKYTNRLEYDLVHLKTTMSFVNHKTKTIHLHIVFPYTGTVEDAGGGTEAKAHQSLRSVNANGKLTWEKDLEPGETLSLSFKTKAYVNPHGY